MSKIVFIGTSEFGLPALEKLRAANFEIVGVVTQPDRPSGRGLNLEQSPVKKWALGKKIPIYAPEKLILEEWNQKVPQADVYVLASYGKIIPGAILELPSHGSVNIHPSLLPTHRGPSPIQGAILRGDSETGVTIMKMDAQMDHGPIIGQQKLSEIDQYGYRQLHDELAKLGAELLVKVLPDYLQGKIMPREQDHGEATFTGLIEKEHAKIDWRQDAQIAERKVRAFEELPGAWTTYNGKRIKILKAKAVAEHSTDGIAGQIMAAEKILRVKCAVAPGNGFGILEIFSLQEEGGKPMDASAFIAGRPDIKGKLFV